MTVHGSLPSAQMLAMRRERLLDQAVRTCRARRTRRDEVPFAQMTGRHGLLFIDEGFDDEVRAEFARLVAELASERP